MKQSDIANYSCIVSTQVDSVVSNMANLNIEEVNLRSKVFVHSVPKKNFLLLLILVCKVGNFFWDTV